MAACDRRLCRLSHTLCNFSSQLSDPGSTQQTDLTRGYVHGTYVLIGCRVSRDWLPLLLVPLTASSAVSPHFSFRRLSSCENWRSI